MPIPAKFLAVYTWTTQLMASLAMQGRVKCQREILPALQVRASVKNKGPRSKETR